MEAVANHEETEDGFAKRIGQTLNEGFTALGISLGSKLGIFDLMISFDQPKTSQEIADAGGFKERYDGRSALCRIAWGSGTGNCMC